MVELNTIIFDFGGVLIDWNPRYLYRKIFDNDQKVEWFLANICHYDWNVMQDAGREIEEAELELIAKFPEYRQEIRAYYGRWEEMLGGPIGGSVNILRRLKNTEYRLLGLTNWSQQTFPIAQNHYDFLEIFEGIVVSGQEKVIKPDPAIYKLIIDRYNLDPRRCIFIDDAIRNINAAMKAGMKGILFESPDQLELELRNHGILMGV